MNAPLVRLPLARLTRTPRAGLALGLLGPLVALSALAARRRGGALAVDHVLLGAYAELALPLASLAITAAAFGGKALADAIAPLVGFGAARARAALAHVAVASIASAAAGAALAALAVLLAHSGGGAPLGFDVIASAYVGLLGGAAYAALFAFGSAFGPSGAGRAVAFFLDWALGGGAGFFAMLAPRAHIRALLGDASRLELSQRGSAVTLGALALALSALAVLKAARSAR